MSEPAQRFVIDGDGRVVWVRTPFERSIRFSSATQAVEYYEAHSKGFYALLPLLVGGVLMTLLPDKQAFPVFGLAVSVAVFGLALWLVWFWRAFRGIGEVLSWSESAVHDDRPVAQGAIANSFAAAGVTFVVWMGILALLVDGHRISREPKLGAVALGVFALFAFCTVVLVRAGLQHARRIAQP